MSAVVDLLLQTRREKKQGHLRREGSSEEERSAATRVAYAAGSASGRSLRMRVRSSISVEVRLVQDIMGKQEMARDTYHMQF